MKTEIVVARYNENLDWLKKIKKSKDLKITVYNKGKDDIDVPFIKLQNVGRESHTYLYHIINNYHHLADQTIFCQGDSIFHSPGFLDLINKHRKKFEPVQPLSSWYWPDRVEPMYLSNPPLPILEKTKDLWFDKKTPIHVEYMDNNFATLYPFHYIENDFIILNNKIKCSYCIENPLKFNIERFRLKDVDINYLFPVCYAALFSINKQAILDNSIDFYNNIISILVYDIRNYSRNKLMDHGLILEKLWLVIFNYKKYNKNYIPLKVKDFVIQNHEINVKNNIVNFSYFNIYFQLFMSITLDDKIYNAFISPRSVYFKMKKDFKMLYNVDAKSDISIYELLKDNTQNNILIIFSNNILKISINNVLFIDYNFNHVRHKILKSITVFDMAKYNNFTIN
jgi:hypothetical protein